MAKEGSKRFIHVDNPLPSSVGGIMHLFDVNEALVRRRLLGARRSIDGLEPQMSFMNQPPDLLKCIPLKHEHAKCESKVSEKSAFVKKKSQNLQIKELLAMETAAAQRVPSVVARLMGLEMLPSESAANIQPKPTQMGTTLTRSLSDKQFQKQKQEQDFQCVPKQLLDQQKKFIREPINLSRHSSKEKSQYESARKKSHGQKNKVNDSEAWKHSQVMQLEQMKRQLALKQVLVQEKLTEAKRLLTGEQSTTSNWDVAYKKISEMEIDSDPMDLFRSMSLSRTYVDSKDKLVAKHSEEQFSVRSKMVSNKKPNPSFNSASTEDITDPIFRSQMIDAFARPIESRRHPDFNMFDVRETGVEPFSQEREAQRQSGLSKGNTSTSESGYKGMDWDFIREKDSGNAGGKTHKPTRIVVLKPSPTVQSNEKLFMSSGSYLHAYNCEPMMDGSMSLDRRVRGHRKDMHEDPREIAREIARQVREKVVQELARKNKRSGSAMSRNIESAERTAIPETSHFNASEIDLERFKAHSKGMASLNKPEEANVFLMSKKGERILSKEKFRVALPENDLTDDKIVVSHQKTFFGDGDSNEGCAFESQDLEFSNTELIDASSFETLADSGKFEKFDESRVKATQRASETLLQCTEECKVSLPPSLNSWLPVDRSLQGEDKEHLEKETESGHSSGNAAIQDKGLIFEQLKESCKMMQTNLGHKDALREEDTDSESSYFLPKFQSHGKIFGEFSDSSLHNFLHGNQNMTTEECCKMLSQSKTCKQTYADTHSSCSVKASALHDGKLPADLDVYDNTVSWIPSSKQFKSICAPSDILPQNDMNVPEEAMFKPCTDESTKEESEDGDLTDFLIGSDGSETSEELSPVSVLVSSFEGSPNHVYLDNNYPLKELPVHLQLLEHDPNTIQMDDSKENGDSEAESLSRHADSSPPGISSSTFLDDDVVSYFSCNDSPQFQYANFQTDDIWCPEGKVEDLCYIGNVLNASGFTGSHESYFAKWHSPHHAINPSLFQRIENSFFSTLLKGSTKTRPKDSQDSSNLEPSCPSNKVDSLHRHLLFDAVDDILLRKLKSHINYQPWFRPTKLMDMLLPSSKQLLKEIWSQLCTFYQQHDGKPFLARPGRDLANIDQWIEVQEEVQKIAFEVEQVVFSELMKEIIIDYALPKSS